MTCFADYLKVNAITDTMGHSAISFCSYCGIRRENTSGGPCICFTSSAHSRRLSFQRLDEKFDIIRELNISTKVKDLLGLSSRCNTDASKFPTVYFSNKLMAIKDDILWPLTYY